MKDLCLIRCDPVVFEKDGAQAYFLAVTRDRSSRIVPWDADPRQFFLTAVPNEIKLLLANLQQMEMEDISHDLINAAFQGRTSRTLEDDSFAVCIKGQKISLRKRAFNRELLRMCSGHEENEAQTNQPDLHFPLSLNSDAAESIQTETDPSALL